MKKLLMKIFISIGVAICAILALVLAFVELRALVAGDYQVFNNPAMGLSAYLFRGLFFLLSTAASIFIIILLIKGKPAHNWLFVLGLALTAGSFFGFVFYNYYVAIVVVLINILPTLVLGQLYFKK